MQGPMSPEYEASAPTMVNTAQHACMFRGVEPSFPSGPQKGVPLPSRWLLSQVVPS